MTEALSEFFLHLFVEIPSRHSKHPKVTGIDTGPVMMHSIFSMSIVVPVLGVHFFDSHWTVIEWPNLLSLDVCRDVTFFEIKPIVIALGYGRISLLHIINSQTSKSHCNMRLLRPLVLICISRNIQIKFALSSVCMYKLHCLQLHLN